MTDIDTERIAPTKAILYCRAGSARAVAQGRDIAYQEALARACADGQGYKTALVVHDVGASASSFDQQSIDAVLDHIAKHPSDRFIVLLAGRDRFARDGDAITYVNNLLTQHGAVLEIIGADRNIAIRSAISTAAWEDA